MMHLLACHDVYEASGVFYALAKGAGITGAAAALLVFGWVRRSREVGLIKGRIARGECISCGYPLGVHSHCTECGRPVDEPHTS